jgi:hypothetical protein
VAPEIWAGVDATAKADVYNFGILMIETVTAHQPNWTREKIDSGQTSEVLHCRIGIAGEGNIRDEGSVGYRAGSTSDGGGGGQVERALRLSKMTIRCSNGHNSSNRPQLCLQNNLMLALVGETGQMDCDWLICTSVLPPIPIVSS